jgi:hypothetical protein
MPDELERVWLSDNRIVLVGDAVNTNERTVYEDVEPRVVIGWLFHRGGRWDWYREKDQYFSGWAARFLERDDAIADLVSFARPNWGAGE